MADYVAAIDQGTTSTRCMLFNHAGESVAIEQLEHKQIYPKPGWVEHDALEIWARTQETIEGVLRKVKATAADIAADRHHQPARDYCHLGQKDWQAFLQCGGVARYTHGQDLRRTRGR